MLINIECIRRIVRAVRTVWFHLLIYLCFIVYAATSTRLVTILSKEATFSWHMRKTWTKDKIQIFELHCNWLRLKLDHAKLYEENLIWKSSLQRFLDLKPLLLWAQAVFCSGRKIGWTPPDVDWCLLDWRCLYLESFREYLDGLPWRNDIDSWFLSKLYKNLSRYSLKKSKI